MVLFLFAKRKAQSAKISAKLVLCNVLMFKLTCLVIVALQLIGNGIYWFQSFEVKTKLKNH